MAGLGNGVKAGHDQSPRLSHQDSRDPALPRSRQDIPDDVVNNQSQQSGGLFRVKSAGESGRRGFHPFHFFKIVWASTSTLSRAVNVLWPFVPAALALYYTHTGPPALRFALSYIAMVPCANLVGFAGQELSRKMPHMLGVLVETTCVYG